MKPSAKTNSAPADTSPCRIAQRFTRPLAAAALGAMLLALFAARLANGAGFDQATLAASKSLEAKFQILDSKEAPTAANSSPVIVTEFEANSYLKVHSSEFLPGGVRTPTMSFQPEHASASTDVDFDELSRTYPNPNDMAPKILAAMFHGTQHVTVVAKIQPEAAGEHVEIESVVVGSMTVPKWLVDYVIQNVLQPKYNFDLSKPVPYPDHVTQIVLGTGQVTCLRGSGKQ